MLLFFSCKEESKGDYPTESKGHFSRPFNKYEYNVKLTRSWTRLYRKEKQGECPNVDNLTVKPYMIKKEYIVDPWGNKFIIVCEDKSKFKVISKGPDSKLGTDDDIDKYNTKEDIPERPE